MASEQTEKEKLETILDHFREDLRGLDGVKLSMEGVDVSIAETSGNRADRAFRVMAGLPMMMGDDETPLPAGKGSTSIKIDILCW